MERCFGKIRNEKKVCSTTAALRALRRLRQFFPKTTSIDLEAQKKLDQKNHSTLEINSPKGGDIAPKMGKTLAKKIEISKFQIFIDFFKEQFLIFLNSKMLFDFFHQIFRQKTSDDVFLFTYFDPNISQDSKNRT